MLSFHDFLHQFIVIFGFVGNAAAIVVILCKTQPALREYSLLLLNTSIIELLSIIAHFSVNGRLFIDSTSIFCISTGPCHLISDNFCAVVAGFMNSNMVYSITILSISFWYRTRILQERGVFGRCRLQCVIVVLYLPQLFHVAAFVLSLTPSEVLEPIADRFYIANYVGGHGMHGFFDITQSVPALLMGYLVSIPFVSTMYIIYTRRLLIRILRQKMLIMSVKTHGVHESFIKVLTIDATMSFILFFVLVVLAMAQEFFELHSVNIEGLEYDIAVLPALINPVLTLYFVRVYREFIKSCFYQITCESTLDKPSTSITFQGSMSKQKRLFAIHNSMSFSVHYFIHIFIVIFGTAANVTAIAVIILKPSKALKEYSLLLLNTAIVELASVLAHGMVNGRLFIDSTTVMCISDGPCRLISDDFCAVITGFMNINMIHSTTILSLSFWYRTRIIHKKGAFGRIRLQLLIIFLFIPHIFHIAAYVHFLSPRDELEPIVDRFFGQGNSSSFGMHGLVDIFQPVPALVMGYLVVYPSFFNNHIVIARQELVKTMREKMRVMSVKTRGIHESFTKVLTIQAVISSGVVLIVMVSLAVAQVLFHLHSVDIEGLEYDVAVMAALINPVLMLYFVRDYRTFVLRCLTCNRYVSNSPKVTMTNSSVAYHRRSTIFSNRLESSSTTRIS